MDQVWVWIRYACDHPRTVVIAAAVLAALYYLANRKPKATRDAENRLAQLREKQADHYNKVRPPR